MSLVEQGLALPAALPEKHHQIQQRLLREIGGQAITRCVAENILPANVEPRLRGIFDVIVTTTQDARFALEHEGDAQSDTEASAEARERQKYLRKLIGGDPVRLGGRLDIHRNYDDQQFDLAAQFVLSDIEAFDQDCMVHGSGKMMRFTTEVTANHPSKHLRLAIVRHQVHMPGDFSYLGENDPNGVHYSMAFEPVANHRPEL